MIDLSFYDTVEIFHQQHYMNVDHSFKDILENFEKNIKKKDFGSISLYYGKNYNQFKIYNLLFYENKIIDYDSKYEEFMKEFKKICPDTICQIENHEDTHFISYILTYFDENFDEKMNKVLKKKGEE